MTIDGHKTTILAFFLGALLGFAAGYSYSANPAPAVVESTQCRSLRLATKAAAGLTKLAEDFETESRLEQMRDAGRDHRVNRAGLFTRPASARARELRSIRQVV